MGGWQQAQIKRLSGSIDGMRVPPKLESTRSRISHCIARIAAEGVEPPHRPWRVTLDSHSPCSHGLPFDNELTVNSNRKLPVVTTEVRVDREAERSPRRSLPDAAPEPGR
jgi:hypothetical protein